MNQRIYVFFLILSSCLGFGSTETRANSAQEAPNPWLSEALTKKITLSEDEVPLPDFLAQISLLTQVQLQIEPGSDLAQKKISAGLTQVELKTVMTCLMRMYGFTWNYDPKAGWTGHYNSTPAERSVLGTGTVSNHLRPEWSASGEFRRSLAERLQKQYGDQLRSPEGLRSSDVMDADWEKTKQQIATLMAIQFAGKYQNSAASVIESGSLSIRERLPGPKSRSKDPQVVFEFVGLDGIAIDSFSIPLTKPFQVIGAKN